MATSEQQALVDAVRRALEADHRVEAAWLSGSLGRGQDDAFSDVDVTALVGDGLKHEVSRHWAANAATIAEPVLVRSLFDGAVVHVVTTGWQRFDLFFVEADQLHRLDAAWLKPLFVKGDRQPPSRPWPDYQPSPAKVRELAEEFMRILGLTPVAAGRGDWANALSGIELLRRCLIDLMLEDARIAPWNRGGALHLNRLLRPDQYAALLALPPVSASPEPVLEANRAIAALFLPTARRLAEETGAEWPGAMEDALRRRLKDQLELDI